MAVAASGVPRIVDFVRRDHCREVSGRGVMHRNHREGMVIHIVVHNGVTAL